jgi:hypothetical protein
MISRRAFMQGLAMLAAGVDAGYATTLAKPPLPTEPPELVSPVELPIWTPTNDAVADWLVWYKAWVTGQFPDVKAMFPSGERVWRYTNADGSVHETVITNCPIDETAGEMLYNVAKFEAALAKLETTRVGVGWAQGLGYETGRRSNERVCRTYSGPCNEGFAWHNGWMQGHLDYERSQGRGPKPLRGQSVYWPPGHPNHK